MGKVILNDTTLTSIADAIRSKNGETNTYLPAEMPQKILDIQSGGGKQANAEFAYSRGNAEKIAKFAEVCEDYIFNCNDLFKTTYSHEIDRKNISIISANYMFNFITNITGSRILDFSGFDLSQCIDMSNMFRNCNAITEIAGIENWDVHNVHTLNSAFYYCNNVTKFDLSQWNLDKCEDFYNVFNGCNNMSTLILPDLPVVTDLQLFTSVGDYTKVCNITFANNGTFGNKSSSASLTLDFSMIWLSSSTYNKNRYTNFANSIGENTSGKTRTIKLYTTLYNSLSDEQKSLLTDKGYTISYGTS